MAITNFIPEVWSAQLLSSLKKTLVFGAVGKTCNNNYEGEVASEGDTVHITSISRPTIIDYVKNVTSLVPETLTDAERALLIDQSKAFVFEVDDIDMRQSKNGGALMSEAADEAAYGLADVVDLYLAGLYTDADTANEISTTAITTPLLAATGLVNLKTKLDTANVPTMGRYAIVPPWYHNLLLLPGSGFVSVADAGTSEGLRNGHVGRAFGFDIYMSNNVTNVTGDDYLVSAGYPGAITFANQINKVEAFRPESAFSDALKGLSLYGAKLVRPSGIATLVASIT